MAGLPPVLEGGVVCSLYAGWLKMSPASELPASYTDYSCALQRDILLQGRLYLSENWICFYSNIFRWETLVQSLDLGWWGIVWDVGAAAQWWYSYLACTRLLCAWSPELEKKKKKEEKAPDLFLWAIILVMTVQAAFIFFIC